MLVLMLMSERGIWGLAKRKGMLFQVKDILVFWMWLSLLYLFIVLSIVQRSEINTLKVWMLGVMELVIISVWVLMKLNWWWLWRVLIKQWIFNEWALIVGLQLPFLHKIIAATILDYRTWNDIMFSYSFITIFNNGFLK